MQVVIAVTGQEQSFFEAGFRTPKFLIPFFQHEALVHVIRSFPTAWKKIVVLSGDFDNRSKATIEKITANKNLNVQLVEAKNVSLDDHVRKGSSEAVMAVEAVRSVKFVKSAVLHLDLQKPVWVTDGSVAFFESVEAIQDKWSSYDLGLLNFTGFHPSYLGSSTYSHVQLSADETEVVKVCGGERLQKNILDEVTSAGVFYFKKADLLKEMLGEKETLAKKVTLDDKVTLVQASTKLKSNHEIFFLDMITKAVETKNYRVGNHLVSNFLQMSSPEDKVRADYWVDYLGEKYPNLESVYSQLPVHQKNLQEILNLSQDTDDLLGLEHLRGLRTLFEEEKKYWLRCWSGLQKI